MALLAGLLAQLPARAGHIQVDVGGGFDAAFNDVGPLPDPNAPGGFKPLGAITGPPSHGILFARYQHFGLWKRNLNVALEYNTDTLAAQLHVNNAGFTGLSVSLFARAEALLAGVNVNWMQEGKNRQERGFGASYVLGGGRVAYAVWQQLFVEVELAARGWLFNRMPQSASNLRIPAPFVTAEPRFRLKWEGARGDVHRMGMLEGVRVVGEVAADVRAFNKPFGGFTDGPVEKRNALAPGSVPHRVALLAQAGTRLGRLLWFHAQGQLGYGNQEDDLTRARVGGQNPYTVNLPGAAWGEFVSERYAATSVGLGVRPMPLLFTGVTGHLVVVNDPQRVGALNEVALLRGISAEARVGLLGFGHVKFQVGGNVDVLRPHGRGAMGAFVWLELGNPTWWW